jgi:TPR repeat protein
LLNGHGIEPNIEAATYWFNKAANLGEGRAYFSLA